MNRSISQIKTKKKKNKSYIFDLFHVFNIFSALKRFKIPTESILRLLTIPVNSSGKTLCCKLVFRDRGYKLQTISFAPISAQVMLGKGNTKLRQIYCLFI